MNGTNGTYPLPESGKSGLICVVAWCFNVWVPAEVVVHVARKLEAT
jgi:hypothetical protein